jgi:RNA polymerase sigma factor (sigma-70 family)
MPSHAIHARSLLSLAKSTLPQSPSRKPRRMNTSAKARTGEVTTLPTSAPRMPSGFAMGRPMIGQSDASQRSLVPFFLLLRLDLEWAGRCISFGDRCLYSGGFGASPEGFMGCMVAVAGCPTMDRARIARAAIGCGNEEAFLAHVFPAAARLQRLAMRYAGSRADAEDICQESMLKAYLKMGQFDGEIAGRDGVLEYEFQAWLKRITVNSAIDYLRRKQAKRFVSWEETVHGRLGSDGSSSGTSSGPSRGMGSRETNGLAGGMPDEAAGAPRNGLAKDRSLGSSLLGNSSAWAENPERAYLRKERRKQMARAIAKLPVELRRVCLLRNVLQYTTKEVAARLGISTTAVRVRLFRAQARLRERMPQA